MVGVDVKIKAPKFSAVRGHQTFAGERKSLEAHCTIMYCYPQMEQTDFPPQIGVSLAGRNVIKVSHKIKKIL